MAPQSKQIHWRTIFVNAKSVTLLWSFFLIIVSLEVQSCGFFGETPPPKKPLDFFLTRTMSKKVKRFLWWGRVVRKELGQRRRSWSRPWRANREATSPLFKSFYLVLGPVVNNQGTALVIELWPNQTDFLIVFHLSHVCSLRLFDQ